MLIMTIPALPISFIETYTFLSYFVTVGIIIATIGMVMIFGYLGEKISRDE